MIDRNLSGGLERGDKTVNGGYWRFGVDGVLMTEYPIDSGTMQTSRSVSESLRNDLSSN